MSERRRFGDSGERLAVAHLEAKGYSIIERNFRVREGEIDIVATRDGLLVFVEVKIRRGSSSGTAAESITPIKQKRLLALADSYGQRRDGLPEQRRIDVIAVDLMPDGRLLRLEHIENAVDASL
jgi:putative endonuclease